MLVLLDKNIPYNTILPVFFIRKIYTIYMKNRFTKFVEQIEHYTGKLSGKTVLDIGTMNGKLPEILSDHGAIVTAVDINSIPVSSPRYEFIQIPFEYFNVDNKLHYDIAIATNVLPFLIDKKYSMQKFLSMADVQLFNVWGEKHAWMKKKLHYTANEIEELKIMIQETHDILFFEEQEYETPTISNPDELTHWHEYNFLIQRKNIK